MTAFLLVQYTFMDELGSEISASSFSSVIQNFQVMGFMLPNNHMALKLSKSLYLLCLNK